MSDKRKKKIEASRRKQIQSENLRRQVTNQVEQFTSSAKDSSVAGGEVWPKELKPVVGVTRHPKTQRWQTWVSGTEGELRNILAFDTESEAQSNLAAIEAKLSENKKLSLADLQGEFQDKAPAENQPVAWTTEALLTITQSIKSKRVSQKTK